MKHLNRLVLLAISANTATAFTAASLYPSTSSPRVRKTTLHSAVSYEMKDIISCASDGLCTVDEMEGMLRELDEINMVCDVDSESLDDCNDDPTEMRGMLKEALTLRLQLHELTAKIRGNKEYEEREASLPTTNSEDHAFDHYVDYKSIAQYESH